MIRHSLALRLELDATRSLRVLLRQAAQAGARGLVLDAGGDLAPDRLSESGRREMRHLLRTAEQNLVALCLPTRRAFDTLDQLDDRLARADRAFALAFELGAPLALIRAGVVPPESEPDRREIFTNSLRELARRAEHRGVVLAIETGNEPAANLRAFLDALKVETLAASLDPASFLRIGIDPVVAARELGPWVAHAYLADSAGTTRTARVVHPGGRGFSPGVLDWEEYLGALEEIQYRGVLTVWPDPTEDPSARFREVVKLLARF